MDKRCKKCGDKFRANSVHKMYCSSACRPVQYVKRSVYHKACIVCHKEMEVGDLRIVTCGEECRDVYNRLSNHFRRKFKANK